jgi:hypothetical protein
VFDAVVCGSENAGLAGLEHESLPRRFPHGRLKCS